MLEAIARHQPVGVSELARQLGADKSGVQRAIMTLADGGWVRAAPGTPTRWQLTAHILAVAHMGHSSSDLRQRARPALEALRNESGETVLLTVPDLSGFVVVDALESPQMLRTVSRIGLSVPMRSSATSRAIMPFMTEEQLVELFGGQRQAKMLEEPEEFAATRARGYSVSEGDVAAGSTNIAAPIFEVDGRPAGAVVVSAPSERLPAERQPVVGAMVVRAARELSHGKAAMLATA